MSQLRVDDMIKCILIIQLDNALGELKLESLYERREAMALKFVKKSLGNYNFSKLFPLREAKHGMKARMSEKYFVTPSRTNAIKTLYTVCFFSGVFRNRSAVSLFLDLWATQRLF